jgi:superoxide dismutase
MFWSLMKKGGGGEPQGDLSKRDRRGLRLVRRLQDQVRRAGVGRFGSGWAWLLVRDGKLVIESTPNQDSPVRTAASPFSGLDVGSMPTTSSIRIAGRTTSKPGGSRRLVQARRTTTPRPEK